MPRRGSRPLFDDECVGCGHPAVEPLRVQNFDVPTCPENVDTDSGVYPCEQGKEFSYLQADFVLPTPGSSVSIKVCDGTIYSPCQWLVICNKYDPTHPAFVKVKTVSSKTITVQNGCNVNNPIVGNPDPGTVFKAGVPVWTATPQWCSSDFNKIIADALNNPDGVVADAVLEMLKNAPDICFQSVPELTTDDNSETWLWGGILADAAGCFRKLLHIITGSNGKTLCFDQIPVATDDPEIVDGNPVPKNYAYLTHAGCLGRGAAVGQSCDDSLNFDPNTSQKINKIWACVFDGTKVTQKVVVPTQNGQGLVAYTDSSVSPPVLRWRLSGVKWTYGSSTELEIYSGSPEALSNYNVDFGPTYANASELLIFVRCILSSGSGGPSDFAITANGVFVMRTGYASGGATSYQHEPSGQAQIPANNTPNVINFVCSGGPPSSSANVQIFVTIQGWK